jgi:hypothetical protein
MHAKTGIVSKKAEFCYLMKWDFGLTTELKNVCKFAIQFENSNKGQSC